MLINGFTLVHSVPLQIVVHPYSPYIKETKNGKIDGIAVRRVNEAFCRMGQNISLNMRPWKRAYSEAQSNMADAIFTIFKTPERELLFDFSKNYIVIQKNILAVRKASQKMTSTPNDLSELKKYELDYVRGYSLGSKLDNIKGKYIPLNGASTDPSMLIRKLLKSRFDALILDKSVLIYNLNNLDLKNDVRIIAPPVQEVPSYIAFPKKRGLAGVRDQFDKAIELMIKDGTFRKVADNFLTGKQKSDCSQGIFIED